MDERGSGTLGEIYEAAEAKLAPSAWAFLSSGAGVEATVRGNRDAFAAWRFVPRVLQGVAPPPTAVTFAGVELSMPVMTAPFGADGLFHPDGHLAVAAANARAGIASIVPEPSSYALEQVAEHAPSAARVFQLQPVGDRDRILRIAERARAAGYQALCLTLDNYPLGVRDRLQRTRFSMPVSTVAANYKEDQEAFLEEHTRFRAAGPTWEQVGALIPELGVPVILKGILAPEDARLAVEVGAAAILVSNHGGRQLDWAVSPLDQLPLVAEAVAGRIDVGLDGGVRRGTDVVKALALGARVVTIGRAAAMALAAGGEDAVVRLLELLREEMITTMALCGRPTLDALDATMLRRVPA